MGAPHDEVDAHRQPGTSDLARSACIGGIAELVGVNPDGHGRQAQVELETVIVTHGGF